MKRSEEPQLNIRLPPDLIDVLDKFCYIKRVKKRDVIELALRRFLASEKGN